MKIRITCMGAVSIPLEEFEEFQGELKSLSVENYLRLREEIIKEGFSFPPNVWRNGHHWTLIDGHQRLRTVRRMVEEEGWECPFLPASIVEADSLGSAKRKLLAATSAYGHIESDGLLAYVTAAEIAPEELIKRFDLPGLDLKRFIEANYDNRVPEHPTDSTDSLENEMRHASKAVKSIKLSFDLEKHAEFLEKAGFLAPIFAKENLSDTIFEVIKEMYDDIKEEQKSDILK